MYLRIILTSIFLLSLGQAEAQSVKDKLFTQWGYQAGYFILPSYDRLRYDDPFSGSTTTDTVIAQGLLYELSFTGRIRYNILEMNDDQSIGISIVPALSYIGQGSKVGSSNSSGSSIGFNTPLELSLNLGAGSTYNSSKDFGVSINTGVDFMIPDLFISRKNNDDEIYPEKIKNFYALPYVGLGVSYWANKGTKLNEIFIRVEFGKNQHTESLKNANNVEKPIGVRAAYIRYIGY